MDFDAIVKIATHYQPLIYGVAALCSLATLMILIFTTAKKAWEKRKTVKYQYIDKISFWCKYEYKGVKDKDVIAHYLYIRNNSEEPIFDIRFFYLVKRKALPLFAGYYAAISNSPSSRREFRWEEHADFGGHLKLSLAKREFSQPVQTNKFPAKITVLEPKTLIKIKMNLGLNSADQSKIGLALKDAVRREWIKEGNLRIRRYRKKLFPKFTHYIELDKSVSKEVF